MASLTANFASFANVTGVGSTAWANTSNAASSNDSRANTGSIGVPGANVKDLEVKLVQGGTIGGDNKADTGTNWTGSDTVITYGTSSDLWGRTWTAAQVKASDFGAVIAADCSSDSNYLRGLDASSGLSAIPDSAIIDGIILSIERRAVDNVGREAQVDHMSVTVHYTLVANGLPLMHAG